MDPELSSTKKLNSDTIFSFINEAIDKLGLREKRILLLRFFNGKTQTEVSAEIGISQAQVSRLEKGALEKIRKQL